MYVLLVCGLILISHSLAYKDYPQKGKDSDITTEEETERVSKTVTEETERVSKTVTKETMIITEAVTESTTIGIYSETTTEKKYTRGTMGIYNAASEDFVFADDYIYQKLKKAYAETDFSAEIKKGDLRLYDFYKSKFYKLVNNEVPFFDQCGIGHDSINTDIYFSDTNINLSNPPYQFPSMYFFDIDGDTAPELCIYKGEFYVFKYIKEEDKFILWYHAGSYSRILGVKKIAYEYYGIGGDYSYYILNDSGKPVKSVDFSYVPIKENVTVFMAAFPAFPTYNAETNSYDFDQKKVLDIEMQKQGYDQKDTGLIFFRITEEQYDELTKEYYQGTEDSRKALAEVEYTYDELFGEFEDFE